MPRSYEHVRDKYIAAGVPEKEAKTRAAKWYNAHHKHKNPWKNEDKPSINFRIGRHG